MSLISKTSMALAYNALRVLMSIVQSIVYSIVVVRWLRISQFGGYAFLDSIFSILMPLYLLGTHKPALRFVPELLARKDYPSLRTLVRSLGRINQVSSALAAVFIFTAAGILFDGLGRPELVPYAQLMALIVIPSAILSIKKSLLSSTYNQKFLSFSETIFSFLELSLLILFVVVFDLHLTGAIMVYVVSYTLAATTYSIYLKKKVTYLSEGSRTELDDPLKRRIKRYTAPLVALDLISSIMNSVANILIGTLRTLEDVAYFDIPNSFVTKVLNQIWLVIGPIGLVSLTEVDQNNNAKLHLAIQQYVKIISLYVLPMTIAGIILAEPILTTFYGQDILPSVLIFRLLLFAYGILNILAISELILNLREKTHIILIVEVLRMISTTMLGLWLIPVLGIAGAVVSTVIPSAFRVGYYTYFVIAKIRIGYFVPYKSIIKYLAASLLMGMAVYTLHNIISAFSIPLLIASIIIGPLTYILGLRLVRAFDEKDKQMFIESRIPLKYLILRIFW